MTCNPRLTPYFPGASLNRFRTRQQSLHSESPRGIPLAEFLGYGTAYLFDDFFFVEEAYFAFCRVDVDVYAVGLDEE